jgi:hypothetical protein
MRYQKKENIQVIQKLCFSAADFASRSPLAKSGAFPIYPGRQTKNIFLHKFSVLPPGAAVTSNDDGVSGGER